MKPARRNFRPIGHIKYPEPTVPKLSVEELRRPIIADLIPSQMQLLAHNAVMWCDHDGGTVLQKDSNPFSAHLSMENRNQNVEAQFYYQTSPYSNGNLNVHVWYQGRLVFAAHDTPGPVYQYPSKDIRITTYVKGPWENFLLDKGYRA